jgi:uncharacterized protein YecT (DUF1311 family)
MKVRFLLSFLSLTLCSQFTHANHHEPRCQQKNTLEMNQCWTQANQKIDAELHDIWARIEALPKDKSPFDKQKLIQSQHLWVQFRKADCSKYNQGTISTIMNAKCYYVTTKTRIHGLKHLCRGLGDTPIC